MSDKKVTVLLTVFNGMPYLERTVRSILGQTLDDFCFLILDNGSTDAGGSYLEGLRDERIRLLKLEETLPRTQVLRKGLDLVETEYTAIIDADDLAEPTRLDEQAAWLEANPDCALVGSDVIYIDEADRVIGHMNYPTASGELRANLPVLNQFAHAAVMFRTGAARAVGGYPAELGHSQDLGLWIALLRAGHGVGSLPKALARIRLHARQTSGNPAGIARAREDGLRLAVDMAALPGLPVEARQLAELRAAGYLFLLGRRKEAWDGFARVFRLAPLGFFVNPYAWKRIKHQLKIWMGFAVRP